ncbi:MAG: radical SAM protein [Magnetococcales bacterium]|nr:radical SAM protein [Magnetococcales bacterium]MBF0150033.1 radical SAM protein [Magnetococcales bacterium]MBF0629524.1 radical SAM protein [Magnetococcales bacterium]
MNRHHDAPEGNGRMCLYRRVTDIPSPPCLHPWSDVWINAAGWVSCCPQNRMWWGNLRETPLERLWNSDRAGRVRRNIASGCYQEAGCDRECPYLRNSFQGPAHAPPVLELINPEFFDPMDGSDYSKNIKEVETAYRERQEHLTCQPLFVDLQTTVRCNSDCFMCQQPHRDEMHLPIALMESLAPYRATAGFFRWQGGESFIRKDFTAFLERFDDPDHPHCRRSVISNGSFLGAELLKRLILVDRPPFFLISMDAVSEECYRNIRRTTNHAKVMTALETLSQLQITLGRTDLVTWNYVVMKSNFSEMALAMDLAERWGINLNFAPLQGKYPEENLFLFPELMDREELLLRLADMEDRAKELRVRITGFSGMRQRVSNRDTFRSDQPETIIPTP